MPVEQIYFMFGFGVCFVFAVIVFIAIRIAHKSEADFQRGVREISERAIRERYEREIEELSMMKGFKKEYEYGERC